MENQREGALKEAGKLVKQHSNVTVDTQHINSTLFKTTNRSFDETAFSFNELNIFYIFVALSAIIILIFVVRAMRFKTKKSTRIRRYGVLTAKGDVEMMPLDNEDDDEDATVFDITDHSVPQP